MENDRLILSWQQASFCLCVCFWNQWIKLEDHILTELITNLINLIFF